MSVCPHTRDKENSKCQMSPTATNLLVSTNHIKHICNLSFSHNTQSVNHESLRMQSVPIDFFAVICYMWSAWGLYSLCLEIMTNNLDVKSSEIISVLFQPPGLVLRWVDAKCHLVLLKTFERPYCYARCCFLPHYISTCSYYVLIFF